MKIRLICIALLAMSFNAFSEIREIDTVYFSTVMCLQMKSRQHPIANRHTIYNLYKCLDYSKDRIEKVGNREIMALNAGFVPLDTYDYMVVYNNSLDEHGNLFAEISLPTFYDQWESCPVDFNHSEPSAYACRSYQVHVSCDTYLDNLEKRNLITNERKWRYRQAKYVPLYSYNRRFKGAISCEEFQSRPSLENLWANVPNGSALAEQWETALEEERKCQRRNPTQPDSLTCMKSTDAYKALFD
jgi:hypothetical protein